MNDWYMQQHGHISKEYTQCQPQKVTYCMIPFIWHSGTGETVMVRNRSMGLGVGGRQRVVWGTCLRRWNCSVSQLRVVVIWNCTCLNTHKYGHQKPVHSAVCKLKNTNTMKTKQCHSFLDRHWCLLKVSITLQLLSLFNIVFIELSLMYNII